jgi:hypothetical protein
MVGRRRLKPNCSTMLSAAPAAGEGMRNISQTCALLAALIVSGGSVEANSSRSSTFTVPPGQREFVKNLIFSAKDRKWSIKVLQIRSRPRDALGFALSVTKVDGSAHSIPLVEGENLEAQVVVSGRLVDLRVVRIRNDVSQPVQVQVFMHTTTEGENSFP